MKNDSNLGRLVLLDGDHSGRDEMNLAGNPFALLQAASKSGQTHIRREWLRTLASGKTVLASWTVNGDAKLGLPGPSEELLYLVLLQLTREERDTTGLWPQTVHFSRHNVFARLGWSGNSRDYALLRDAFFRLQAVSIQTIYAFHDPRTGGPMPAIAFNLIDSFAFSEEKSARKGRGNAGLSWFKWSDTLHASFEAGNVRSLALDFTLSLDLPISRRLFRLLELLRHAYKPALPEVRMDIFQLRDRLAMTDYKFPSKIREKLAPALAELKERGYLAEVRFDKTGKGAETAVFGFQNIRTSHEPPKPANGPQNVSERPQMPIGEPIESKLEFSHRMAAVFAALPEEFRDELRDEARAGLEPIFWDRLDNPDSPLSLELWQIVEARQHQQRVG